MIVAKSNACLPWLIAPLAMLLLGCAGSPQHPPRTGPNSLSPVRVEEWTYGGEPARRAHS